MYNLPTNLGAYAALAEEVFRNDLITKLRVYKQAASPDLQEFSSADNISRLSRDDHLWGFILC